MAGENKIIIATRGSALALAQANLMAAEFQRALPELSCELKIIKTTGDKMQTAALANSGETLPKGLFTKELEVALLNGEADVAVHSLKDLPTDLPEGLMLAATPKREDVRDVLIYRGENDSGFAPHFTLNHFPQGAMIATSSTRRKMSLLALRSDLKVVAIRGNVATRMQKLAEQKELAATVLALAGMKRLHFKINGDGSISGDGVPAGLFATILSQDEMLPCVGQGAIGLETRMNDERIAKAVARLNHAPTFQAITAERAFLRGMGGGCQSPVGALAEVFGDRIVLKVISFRDQMVKCAEGKRSVNEAVLLGEQLAAELK